MRRALAVVLLALVITGHSFAESGIFGDAAPGAGAWVGTATSALGMATYGINFGTDPGDSGDVNLENATSISWESAPSGTDGTISFNSGESFVLQGSSGLEIPNAQDLTDVADLGLIRLPNTGAANSLNAVAWEASPAAPDVYMNVDASERFVFTNNTGVILPIQQADLTASCTLGEWGYDTGGSADELCYCQATNVWMCATVTAGPAD
jgi:hypothetical protein